MAVVISQGSSNMPRDQPVLSQRHVNGHCEGTMRSDSTTNTECLPHLWSSIDIDTWIILVSHRQFTSHHSNDTIHYTSTDVGVEGEVDIAIVPPRLGLLSKGPLRLSIFGIANY